MLYNIPCWLVMILVFGMILNGCNKIADQPVNETNETPVVEVADSTEENTEVSDEFNNEYESYRLMFGDLVSTHENGDTLIVKAKIEHVGSNKQTIDQNGYNIEDLILNQNVGEKFKEIQYWAVADMNNGSEDKVISFTINSDLIQQIQNKKVVANQIIDHASDVWILPSLK